MNTVPFPQSPPYHRFEEFIAPDADRYSVLQGLLTETHLNHQVVTIAGNRHFLIFPGPQQQYEWPGLESLLGGPELLRLSLLKNHLLGDTETMVLAAHYDRVNGSPGANDNSAAVFQLVETALLLKKEQAKRWFILFTDKEELGTGEGVCDQGAYTLAKGLRDAGFKTQDLFIFDACGSGDTLIISTVVDILTKNDERLGSVRIRHRAQQLRTRALETARKLALDRVLLSSTPFSDDAGFLRAGIAAQTITMLPAAEAASLVSLVRNKPDFADALISRNMPENDDKTWIPATWRRLNGSDDELSYLTPQHFSTVVRFAQALCYR